MADRQEMVERARGMGREPTEAEQRMWRRLRSHQLVGLKFRRQFPVGRYIADFACLKPHIVIECDGGQHADTAYDAAQDAWFESQGFRVFRFTNAVILRETEGVIDTLLDYLDRW